MNPPNQEVVDKVLAVLREGASAATGAAKEGFVQLCQFESSKALSGLAILAMVIIASAISLIAAARSIANMNKGMKDYTYYTCPNQYNKMWQNKLHNEVISLPRADTLEDHPLTAVWAVVSAVILVVSMLVLSLCGPELYATYRNPAGAVIAKILPRYQ